MPRIKAVILVTVWPEPESSAAGWRVENVMDVLRSMDAEITIASPSKENGFSDRLKTRGIVVQPIAINDASFDRWIAEQSFDLAILDRFILEEQFGWRIAEHSPKTVRVLDTEDLHFLRRARQAALKAGASLEDIFSDRIELSTEDACREIASIYRSDLSLVISDHENRMLIDRFRVDPELLRVFRFCYPGQQHAVSKSPSFEERRDFAVIGNFRHPPNADATLWLKTEIWPRIRERIRDAELHIYGAYPSKEAMAMTSPSERFYVKGPVPNVHDMCRNYRVNLAPLRFGAGIKGKISDGWSAGTPVVTTPIGAEGMTGSNGCFGGTITRDAEAFAQAAASLYTNAIEWSAAQKRGYSVLNELFDQKRNADELKSTLQTVLKTVEERRERNFIGKMLRHQFLRSTKYFSKWLELKEGASRPLVPELQNPGE